MSALYGHTGPANPMLAQRMAQALRHRGGSRALDSHPGASLGYLEPSGAPPADAVRLGVGLYADAQGAVVVAGYRLPQPGLTTLPELLTALLQEGPEAVIPRLRGAFVLAARLGIHLWLARDALGARSLCYGLYQGQLYFAVEPKAVLAVPGFPRRLRPAALAQYLTFSFVPGGMLADLQELPPGHWLHFCPGSAPVITRYWHLEQAEGPEALSTEDTPAVRRYWAGQFRQTLTEAVAARRPPDAEPVGVFLSGGIDSSVVTAALTQTGSPQTVRTFAIHFGRNYPNELDFARQVATHCHTQHSEVLVRPQDFLPRLRQIIAYLDTPIGDPITVPNFELARQVAQEVRWVFNGEGGDPCFGGPKNLPLLLAHWYGGVERGPRFREQAYLASYKRGYEDLAATLSPEFWAQIDPKRDLEAVLTPYFNAPQPQLLLHKLLWINISLKGGHLILPKVERMTSACGLTAFSPLFDERLVELGLRMPGFMKLAGGIEKIALKEAYQDALPSAIIHRPKSGMRVPVQAWFQGELRQYARSLLNPRQLRQVGLFNPERVQQLLDYRIADAPGRYGLRLWMLLTFELWRRMTLEGEVP